jgi:hypothetical protein
MFIVKLIKYESECQSHPVATIHENLRTATAVHVTPKEGFKALQLGDAPGETFETTIGNDPECSYTVAFIMNGETGRTVETIR